MLKDPRNLLWIMPLAALATLPLWKPSVTGFLRPERPESAESAEILPRPVNESSAEMSSIRFEQNKNGRREWLLTADTLYRSGEETLLEDVTALFYGTGKDRGETRIRSRKAVYDPAAGRISLQGDVVIRTDQGYNMRTETLDYLAAEKKIRTASPVDIQGNNIRVSGSRLQYYDIVSGDYSLTGGVVCSIW
jgi:LPS export ABC transporter protein LptC